MDNAVVLVRDHNGNTLARWETDQIDLGRDVLDTEVHVNGDVIVVTLTLGEGGE